MPFKLCVIWFKDIPFNPSLGSSRHWFLYLHPISSPVGSLYEIDFTLDGWYYNHETDVDPRLTRKREIGGKLVLGEIADHHVERFQGLTREMVLPSLGTEENCQDWVKAIVSEAVDEMLLPSIAMKKVEFCHK